MRDTESADRFPSMDQIVNTLSLYAVENGLLTRCVSASGGTEPTFQLSPFHSAWRSLYHSAS